MVKIHILIFLLMVSIRGWACADIRLDTAGASLASYPVFDQANASAATDMNICYAATAAQLLDSFRATKSQQQVRTEFTSPWWLAVNYSSSFKKEENPDVAFGEPDKALEAAKMDGVCSQEDLFGNKATEDIIRFHQLLKEFYQSSAKTKDNEKDHTQKLESLLQQMDFIKDPAQLAQISLKAVKEKTFVLFLRTLFQGKCQGKVKQEPFFQVQRIEAEKDDFSVAQKTDLIDETLGKALPIETSICSQVLRNPEFTPGKNFKNNCLRHSVLVVGSREKNGQCQYLVRDSYGPESCQRKRNGEPWYSSSLECQNGQVWVPAKSLAKNTWGFTRVAEKED